VLFREGDGGRELYVVRAGTMLVSKPCSGTSSKCSRASGPAS